MCEIFMGLNSNFFVTKIMKPWKLPAMRYMVLYMSTLCRDYHGCLRSKTSLLPATLKVRAHFEVEVYDNIILMPLMGVLIVWLLV